MPLRACQDLLLLFAQTDAFFRLFCREMLDKQKKNEYNEFILFSGGFLMHYKSIQKLVFAAMLGALTFCATFISVPTGIGNVNLGDGILLLGAWTLGGAWSVIACALGATLTDLVGGYAIYAPATLVIKALMGIVAIALGKLIAQRKPLVRHLISGLAAECVMIAGYFVYEAWILGFGSAALVSIPFNAVQGAVALVVSVLAHKLLEKARLIDLFR